MREGCLSVETWVAGYRFSITSRRNYHRSVRVPLPGGLHADAPLGADVAGGAEHRPERIRQFVEQPAMMEIVPVGAMVVTWALRMG
ncbi:MAG: hypothetical protein NTW96_01660 [Planctomycetia bacterium]|nr:hypothetical protein [Planctomycetia bacterium]